MNKIVGRYTLETKSYFNHKSTPITFKWGNLPIDGVDYKVFNDYLEQFSDKEKVPLQLIDYLTTSFPNEEELLKHIYYNHQNIPMGTVQITYKSPKKFDNQDTGRRYVKHVAYSHNKDIRALATHFIKNKYLDDKMLDNYATRLLNQILKDPYFKHYFLETIRPTNPKIIYDIDYYGSLDANDYEGQNFRFEKLKNSLNDYKTLRSVQIVFNNYEANKGEIIEGIKKDIEIRKEEKSLKERNQILKEVQEESKAHKTLTQSIKIIQKQKTSNKLTPMSGQMALFEMDPVLPKTKHPHSYY